MPHGPSEEQLARQQKMFRRVSEYIPHNKALGLRVVTLERGSATLELPYRDDLVGNPITGVLHGGAITSLMDATCGASVMMALAMPVPIATLDLRIDYLRPATPHENVVARGECYRLTRNVAFVRCTAYHAGDEDDAIAAAAGAFMLATPLRRAEDG